jgi:serine/threonine protein kinase
MESLVGQTVGGRYRVGEVLGAGGMGVVYRAHDERLEREVAVKVLAPGVLADERVRKRFRKEALALSRLNHPNIAAVYDFITEGNHDFIVMELISGLTLDQRLTQGPLPQSDVLAIGRQIADALAAAHQAGVIHRDLKPANLRFTGDHRIKVLDFGLADVQTGPNADLTTASFRSDSSVSGTLPYMAPEQLRGAPPDVRSDIYAAGAVLYEMATGKRAFPQNGFLIVDAILNQTPPSPSQVNPQVSPGLENAIVKALDKNPGFRYQTARDMLAELERLSSSTTVTSYKLPPARPRPAGRRMWTAAILAAVFAIVVFGLVRKTFRSQATDTATTTQQTKAEPASGSSLPADSEADDAEEPVSPKKSLPKKNEGGTVPATPGPPAVPDELEIQETVREAMQASREATHDALEQGDAAPGKLEGREGSTLGVMGMIIGANAQYHGKLGYYPASLPDLIKFLREERRAAGKPLAPTLNACQVEPCMVHGYQISYSRPNPQSYALQARPIAYPYTGKRSFLANESGAIRATAEDRAATLKDPVAH